MKFSVYHDTKPSFWLNEESLRRAQVFFDAKRKNATQVLSFVHVADVECPVLGAVFELTNHIDHDWTENSEVTLCTKSPVRSTSVGDAVEDETGKVFMCDSIGWKELP